MNLCFWCMLWWYGACKEADDEENIGDVIYCGGFQNVTKEA